MVVDAPGGAADTAGAPSRAAAGTRRGVSVVVVAFGAEPWLEKSVEACLASGGVDVEVLLVDNGCTDGAVDRLSHRDGVTVVRPGENLGFAAGCNLGASRATHDVLAFVNPDTVADPVALRRLVGAALEPDVGIATCSLRLADDPELLNSAGNEVHFLGLSWAGAFEQPAGAHRSRRDVAAASGAGMAIRRDLWEELGGFVPEFFAYQEDAELSLRVWQHGLRVLYVPDAVIVHRYEFSRNPEKLFLLDRNRLVLVLTLYERRTLALLAPVLVLQEIGITAFAAVDGWFPQRVRSLGWLLRNRGFIAGRRRAVAAARRLPDRSTARLFESYVRPGNHRVGRWGLALQWPLVAYWWLVRRLL